MNFILKIVEGPMRGAEVALAEGLRVSVGSGDDCDVVIADGSLPQRAFELDVAADAVTLVRGDEPQALEQFAPFSVGTTTFAVGPADAPWPEGLAERAREERARGGAGDSRSSGSSSEASDSGDSSPARTTSPSSEAGSPGSAGGREQAGASGEAANEASERRRGRGCLFSATIALLIILLLAVVLYFFWPKISASFPAAEEWRVVLVEKSRAAWDWTKDVCRSLTSKCAKPLPAIVAPGPSLAEIAAQHGLSLSEKDGAPLLSGNLRRRTERLAIRSLAQADDPRVRFDLTDDESLRAAADELLFVVTEGALKAVAASNRVVALEGRVETVAALEKAVRALSADVKGIERLDTAKVSVGGPAPAAKDGAAPSSPAKRRAAKASSPDYPIAGILTAPYPCVVLRNGLRLVEGASIGSALLVKIEADRLTLKDGGATIEWKP